MADNEKSESNGNSFWTTLPGILTGVAAVITAIGGLLAALVAGDVIGPKVEPTAVPRIEAPQATALMVVETMPAAGATGVNPALTEIVVAFSDAVGQDNWSFVETDEGEAPEITGDPFFRDERTCVLPVKLEPGITYSLSVNSVEKKGFRSAEDPTNTVIPYVLTFSTGQ